MAISLTNRIHSTLITTCIVFEQERDVLKRKVVSGDKMDEGTESDESEVDCDEFKKPYPRNSPPVKARKTGATKKVSEHNSVHKRSERQEKIIFSIFQYRREIASVSRKTMKPQVRDGSKGGN